MSFSPTEPTRTTAEAVGKVTAGRRNVLVGWCSLVVGAAVGMVMAFWSFDGPVPVPEWIGSYDTLSRRLLRLGHIAFFGLGILNILLAQHLPQFDLGIREKRLAALCMNIGNIFLPLALIAASIWHPLKYVTSLPATSVFIALAIGARGAIRTSGRGP